jgi:lycopene beta-cyclase
MTHPPASTGSPYDVAIIGAGLAGGLLALALRARRPELRIVLVEAAPHAGGNHLWSFFGSDVPQADRWLVDPLIGRSWPDYEVRFADHARRIATSYASIASARLDARLREVLPPDALIFGAAVSEVGPQSARLADGRHIRAHAVVDARGAAGFPSLELGWQKFAGQLWRMEAPHGVHRPLVMDAAVDQAEGYRFVYLLPFSQTELFIEDTYYSADPALDEQRLSGRIRAYVTGRGWAGEASGHSETGVLPVCMGGDIAPLIAGPVPRIGVGGGFFHAMTGYSLPDAVHVASRIAALPHLTSEAILAETQGMARRHWRGQAFYRLLAAMLFRAADPPERHRILSRFYRLDPALIARFYGGRSTFSDKLRIVSGRPPVSLRRAVAALGASR